MLRNLFCWVLLFSLTPDLTFMYVKNKLTKGNKSLYVLRTLIIIRREGLAVYGAAEIKLTTISVASFGQIYFQEASVHASHIALISAIF